MKDIDYTDHKIKLLFVAGIILVFIILFSSALYPRQLMHNPYKSFENKFSGRFTMNFENYLNSNNAIYRLP